MDTVKHHVLEDPTISIILPFFNAEKTLKLALQSISKQSFENFECILINNNATDKSLEIARDFCRKDLRFSNGLSHLLLQSSYVRRLYVFEDQDYELWQLGKSFHPILEDHYPVQAFCD